MGMFYLIIVQQGARADRYAPADFFVMPKIIKFDLDNCI